MPRGEARGTNILTTKTSFLKLTAADKCFIVNF
jgi:hypothetical protein